MKGKLSPRQRVGIAAVAAGKSHAAAGSEAGYAPRSVKQQVCTLLKKPKAQEYLQSL